MPNFTKKAIEASFLKLLNERPLSKITVKDCGNGLRYKQKFVLLSF